MKFSGRACNECGLPKEACNKIALQRIEIDKLRAEIVLEIGLREAAEQRTAELRAALKPFAAWIDKVDTASPSESATDNNRTCLINGSAVVTYGDFRRAAQALEQKCRS